MPAEWEPHEATWIAWPHNRDDWPGRFTPIPWVYGEIVRKLAAVERVRILVQSAALEAQARRILEKVGANLDAVEFFPRETDRVWTRDYCPLFVKNRRGEIALTAWRFNAWAKYDDWRKDATIPAFVGKRLKLPVFTPEMVLEGGSIDVNGQGLLLTTEECLLSPVQARNPDLSRDGDRTPPARLPGRGAGHLAEEWDRRRRYARTRGRPGALRESGDGSAVRRERPGGHCLAAVRRIEGGQAPDAAPAVV